MKLWLIILAVAAGCLLNEGAEAAGVHYNLPQFGLYADGYGQIFEQPPAKDATPYLRQVEDLIREWSSPYLVKESRKDISEETMTAWKAKNLTSPDARFESVKECKVIVELEDLVCFLANEYMAYGIDLKNFKMCAERLSKLAKDKWMLGIFGGKATITTYRKKAEDTYRNGVGVVNREIWNLLKPLHELHRGEFAKWTLKNPDLFVRLKKMDDDLVNNIVMQKKIDVAAEEARQAQARAAAAEAAARAAEQAARDAEDAANRARWNHW